ncbi:preprotein translocase subunit YajC [Skermanella stibiiresistens SB22]|uniref:Sec translocon accessory complex subunit YajC n=1 Tax=Skermanella stibiiresistens SB22 TaxID=1385369 RepID=W9GT90_9PROT|nr:preprotein translocase subunit YajC [Skermanella stibiiresistens]EWY36999.1 preprotein translocase subunit YajC [Skermanella stibiiresistens SB22]
MFVSTAYAQAADGAGAAGLMSFLPLILIFVVFYFLLIRPQQKKLKEHKAMLESMRRGDRVVTGGGIIGTIMKVGNDDELVVEIAEGVRVRVLRSTVNMVLAKTEPAKGGRTTTTVDDKDGAVTDAVVEPVQDNVTAPSRGIGKMFGRK